MAPEIKLPLRNGWITLAGVLVLGVGGLYWYYEPDLAESVEKLPPIGSAKGKEVTKRITEQAEANEKLRASIKNLKDNTGFAVTRDFRILPESGKAEEREPGARWLFRFQQVQGQIAGHAKVKNIGFPPMLGFALASERDIPKPEDIPASLAMLQLVDKVMTTVVTTPEPIHEVTSIVLGDLRGKLDGPTGRPALLRQYNLTIEIKARLDTLLWILHQFAYVEESPESKGKADYPVILLGASIDSANRTSRDDIPILTGRFTLAGMQFLSDKDRGVNAPVVRSGSASSGGGSRGARP